jgi:hypothetical protein
MNQLKPLFLFALLAFASGCSHTVSYKLNEKDRWTGPKIDKVVRVATLSDQTTPQTDKVIKTEGDSWRTNYRKRYKDQNLASNVSAMIAKHLAYSGLFKKVVYGDDKECDLELSGTLKDYMAMGRIHSTAEGIQAGTAGFGLIGAIVGLAATSGMKTEIRTSVELQDLKLVDTSSHSPVWTGSIDMNNNFPANFEAANATAVFYHADQLLKSAVSEMIQKIGTQQNPTALSSN